MKETGWILATIGVVVAIVALFLSTTAAVTVPALTQFGIERTEEVHNLGLLQRRELVFIAGCTLFLAGMVLGAAGAVIEALAVAAGTQQVTAVPSGHASNDVAPPASAEPDGVIRRPPPDPAAVAADNAAQDAFANKVFIGAGIVIALTLAAVFTIGLP